MSKLPTIVNYLRDLGYKDEDLIPHDDLEFAIEKLRGCDPRTIKKYVILLMRHHYLVPTSTKPDQVLWSKKMVRVRSSRGTKMFEVQATKGWKFYRFGPNAPRTHQKKLVPPCNPPSERNESLSQENMCVQRLPAPFTIGGVDGEQREGRDRGELGVIEGEEEEKNGAHTHILNTVIDENTAKPTSTSEFDTTERGKILKQILRRRG